MATFGGLVPSSSSQVTTSYRVLEFSVGNGYKAVAPDGANPVFITAQVNFDNLDPTRSATLEAWLATDQPWISWAGDGTLLPSSKFFKLTKDGWTKNPIAGGAAS